MKVTTPTTATSASSRTAWHTTNATVIAKDVPLRSLLVLAMIVLALLLGTACMANTAVAIAVTGAGVHTLTTNTPPALLTEQVATRAPCTLAKRGCTAADFVTRNRQTV